MAEYRPEQVEQIIETIETLSDIRLGDEAGGRTGYGRFPFPGYFRFPRVPAPNNNICAIHPVLMIHRQVAR